MNTRIAKAHLLASLMVGAACFAVPRAAMAQKAPSTTGSKADKAPSARELYKAGEAKFKGADYQGALADFQAVDTDKPTPQSARYIGLCQDKLGHYAEAVAAYERFLLNVPPKLQKEGDEIKKRVDEIKAMPGKVHIETVPAGAEVSVDGKPQAQASPVDVDLPSGKHTVHVSAGGREPQDRAIDVSFASRTDVTLQLVESAPPPPPAVALVPLEPTTPAPAVAPPVAEPRSKVPAFVTGGLALVAAGVGTAFGVMALGDKSDFDKNPTTSKVEDGENHTLIADMAFGLAITLGVTSAVLFFTHEEAPAPTAAAQPPARLAAAKKKSPLTIVPSPIITAHGGGAGAVLRF